jgi:hypothetical protein
MKAIFNISYIFLFTSAIYFSIACNFIAAQDFISGKTFDIENTNHQDENSLHNNIFFEDEEQHNDTIVNAFRDFLFITDYSNKISPFKVFIPNSFLSVIWQPPKL